MDVNKENDKTTWWVLHKDVENGQKRLVEGPYKQHPAIKWSTSQSICKGYSEKNAIGSSLC